jgi:hypothetical protein
MPSLAAARIARCAGVSRQKALGFCTAGGATQRLARPIGIVPPFLVAAGLAVDLRHGFRGDEEAVAVALTVHSTPLASALRTQL